jgi:hypothetical protein
MRNNLLILILVAAIAIAFYFLGKKNGNNQTKTTMIENIALVKQIAELSSLQVSGTTQLKVTNSGGEGTWEKFKDYFVENTLQVTIPFDARFGVDMSKQQMKVDRNSGKVTLYFPACTLLSLQLRLDKLETMSETGILASASISDLVKAENKMYNQAQEKLAGNEAYKKLAQENIQATLQRYYEPMGFKVTCVFENNLSLKD